MLECKNLGFFYDKDCWIFRNVDFYVSPGEVFGISGYSGCGKTTLSRILANHLDPCEGDVFISGSPRSKRGFQPVQLICQHPEKGVNPRWKMKKVLSESYMPDDELLERFGIKQEWLERVSIELSGGELQRFLILRALHPDTRYIIADEMTTMLDAITQAYIWKEFLKITEERGIGVIAISHEPALIEKLCDRFLKMD